jgi:MFS transporter, YNFM family, putative membrane transport protein
MQRKESRAILSLRRGALALGQDILILLAVLLAAGAVGGPARSLLPVYLEHDLAWAPPAIAVLAAARLLTAALSAPLGGALADTTGPRLTLRLGLLGLPLAALLFLTPIAPALALLVLAIGVTDGLQATGGQAYLVARASRATIGWATGVFFLGSTLGGALGNLIAGALLDGWGFAGLGRVGLVAGVLVLAGATALPAGTSRPAGHRQTLASVLAGYRPLLGAANVRELALLRFLSTCYWGAATFLWPLLIARLSGDPATAALFGTVSLALAATAQLGTGRLIDAIGPAMPAVVLAGLVPVLATLAALALAAGSVAALFVIGVLGTAAAWSLSGTIPPLIHATAPDGQTGHLVGLLHLLWALAMLTGTLLGGGLVALNPALPFAAVAVLNLPTVLAAVRLRRALQSGASSQPGSRAARQLE